MRIGVTGHRILVEPAAWPWVRAAILREIDGAVVGVTSLAIGADQLFAECVLEAGGTYEAVIPNSVYIRTFAPGAERAKYEELLARASEIQVLPDLPDLQQCYLDAGLEVVRRCEVLLAVWDGKPAAGKGGTGDAVAFALSLGRRVVQMDPYQQVVRILGDGGPRDS